MHATQKKGTEALTAVTVQVIQNILYRPQPKTLRKGSKRRRTTTSSNNE